MKKKIIAGIIACLLSFTFCGCNNAAGQTNSDGKHIDGAGQTDSDDKQIDGAEQTAPSDKHINGEVEEILTVEELVDFYEHGAKYPEGFLFKELEGYGRVLKSAASSEEAISVTEDNFNSGWCSTVECRIEVETDLFYGLYVKWDYRSGGLDKPVTSYYDENVVCFKKGAYDFENKKFGTKDKDEIKQIINYLYYSRTYEIRGSKVYSDSIIENDGIYEYTIYLLEVCYGDWGMQDELTFIREVRQIDSNTGAAISGNREIIGTAFIDGDCTYGGIIVE